MNKKILIISFLICIVFSSYIPELILTTTAQFLNKQLAVNVGPSANKFINQYKASDISFNDTFQGIHVDLNMTNITQTVHANWSANILNINGAHNFSILAKNINITIKAHIQFYIVSKRLRQKGELEIQITELQADSYHSFVRAPASCPKSIGFGLYINDIKVDSSKIVIDIKNHKFDDLIINLIKNLLKSRIPNLINTKLRDTANGLIQNYTCHGALQQVLPIGHQTYILSLNTTDVPSFANNKILTLPIDINFQNQRTNQTNQQVQNQNLFDEHVYQGKANATLTASSNMIDTLLWLVDDSNILSAAVTKEQLGPNPPIDLDTSGLAILLPGLKKYPNKDVIIRVNTSSQYSQVFIRSGRFVSGLSISADFIINNTARIQNLTKCLQLKQCFIATSLNITLGISASVRAQKMNYWSGLLQSIYIADIQVIDSLIDVNIENLKKILNSLILSSRPSINKQLQQGFEFNPASIQKLKPLNLTGIIGQTFLDYASFGLLFDFNQ